MIITVSYNIAGDVRCRVQAHGELPDDVGGNRLFLIQKDKDAHWINIAAEVNGMYIPVMGESNIDTCISQLRNMGMTLDEYLLSQVQKGIQGMQEKDVMFVHGQLAKAFYLYDHWSDEAARIRGIRAAQAAAKEAEKEAEALAMQERRNQFLIELTIEAAKGEIISGADFLDLAKFHNVAIPLRTHGWVRECLVHIGGDGLRWQPKKKGQKLSGAIYDCYDRLKAQCVEYVSQQQAA